jgi:ubiquinone/menaquinone biosynthesis C-methylase UbiE
VGRWEQGVVRFAVPDDDPTIAMYESEGGTTLYERMSAPFSSSALDAPVYHSYLRSIRPSSKRDVVADIGAGDGRNTEIWLQWGYQRVVATDAVLAPLTRMRDRILRNHPDWLSRLLLVQSDMRQVPIAKKSCSMVFAIESFGYGTDYEKCLARAADILKPRGMFLVADASAEGAMLTSLLYHGLEGMLKVARLGRLPYAQGNIRILSYIFSEEELANLVSKAGLNVVKRCGLSVLAPLMSFLRNAGKFRPADDALLPSARKLLLRLGQTGQMRRIHVIIARKSARPSRAKPTGARL